METKYKTLSVPKDTVMDLWELPWYDNKDEGVTIIDDEITSTGRWSVHHKLTVKIKDKIYQTSYSVGATEYQDERPWQDEPTVEFIEMREVEKIVKVLEPVEA